MNYYPLVSVVIAVENKRLKLRFLVALRRGNALDYLLQNSLYIYSHFRGNAGSVVGGYPDNALYLLFSFVGTGGWQIYLVYYGYDLQILFNCQIGIRQRLRLNPL